MAQYKKALKNEEAKWPWRFTFSSVGITFRGAEIAKINPTLQKLKNHSLFYKADLEVDSNGNTLLLQF